MGLWIVLILSSLAYSQNTLTGYVYEKHKEGGNTHFEPLAGASVYWKDTQKGTTTDALGKFKIKTIPESNYLIVSYVGYRSDTLRIIEGQKEVKIVLESIQILNEVEVTARQKGEYIDKLNPIKTEVISSAGLQRLACCNLSESFENSGSVDVSYSDAVTGAKHIQMLGLAGIYTQILAENMPLLQGLSYSQGLTYVPGTWMQSIQVSKGTSSVNNGFESITGQINTEFKRPHLADPLFINVFANSEGRGEVNADLAKQLSEHVAVGLLIHTESQFLKNDHNHDGFLDIPLSKQLNLYNRWNIEKEGIYHIQYGLKALWDDKIGGQNNFNPTRDKFTNNYYGIGIHTEKYDFDAKHGFFLNRSDRSIGIQTKATYHNQNAYFGYNRYDATEKSLYANIIFHTNINNENHKIDIGSSFMYNHLNEYFSVPNIDTLWNNRYNTTGAFAQYTFDYQKVLTMIIGFRADYNNLYKWIYTPRFHIKYDISENSSVRFSLGKGSHFAYPVAENISLMVSARKWYFNGSIKPEDAWNSGISFSHKIKIGDEKNIQINADAYRTEFINQLIIDNITHPNEVRIYELNGKSYSNSFQLNITTSVIKHLDLTLIGRYNDVKQTYQGKLIQKALSPPFKGLFTASYNTKFEKWQFDATVQYIGNGTIPDFSANPDAYQLMSTSPDYTIIHFQITRRFKRWDIYCGVENLTNFTQHMPIIAHDDPFGDYFDASVIWGPIMGRLYYAGLRFKIKK
ncbi:MAG: TonB-dependent receptor [Bacteroidales bacterium]